MTCLINNEITDILYEIIFITDYQSEKQMFLITFSQVQMQNVDLVTFWDFPMDFLQRMKILFVKIKINSIQKDLKKVFRISNN
jgi:hypothetical protein